MMMNDTTFSRPTTVRVQVILSVIMCKGRNGIGKETSGQKYHVPSDSTNMRFNNNNLY